jgi:hypothetical protein
VFAQSSSQRYNCFFTRVTTTVASEISNASAALGKLLFLGKARHGDKAFERCRTEHFSFFVATNNSPGFSCSPCGCCCCCLGSSESVSPSERAH